METLHSPVILGGPDAQEIVEYQAGRLHVAAACDAGFGYKDGPNEDRIVLAENFAAVIDGMGGEADGGETAQFLAEELSRDPEDISAAIERTRARMSKGRLSKRAGACFQAARFTEGERGLVRIDTWQAGDVRRTVEEARGWLRRLFGQPGTVRSSRDETVVEGLIRNGNITRKAAKTHALRGLVSNYLKAEKCTPTCETILTRPGSRLLLYSDGVTENMTTRELVGWGVGRTVRELVENVWRETEERMRNYEERKDRGLLAKRDNRSFLAADFH